MSELPDLHMGTLTAEGVRELAADLRACAERLQVVPKRGAQRYVVPANLSLAEAVEALLAGELTGLQLRYLHEGREWWDTLMARGPSYHLVRVAHD